MEWKERESNSGLFGITEDYQEAYLSLDEYMVKNRESTYFIRAQGQSMMPQIAPGDILVVDRKVAFSSGKIIILTLNGERLCKRLQKRNGQIELVSDNPKYRNISVTEEMDFSIFGVVVGIVKNLRESN